MRNLEERILLVVGILVVIGMITLMCYAFVGLVDSITLEKVGEKSVPCIDKYNRPFENEMCTKKIYCSWLGVAGEDRCVNVLGGEE